MIIEMDFFPEEAFRRGLIAKGFTEQEADKAVKILAESFAEQKAEQEAKKDLSASS